MVVGVVGHFRFRVAFQVDGSLVFRDKIEEVRGWDILSIGRCDARLWSRMVRSEVVVGGCGGLLVTG